MRGCVLLCSRPFLARPRRKSSKLTCATLLHPRSQQVFFLPMRIIRGSPSLSPSKKKDSSSTPIAEFAWLTKEEIQERLGGEKSEYWKAVEGMLSK